MNSSQSSFKSRFTKLRFWLKKSIMGFRENGISDSYIMSMPTDQNAVDLFKGEWSSALPEKGLESGNAALFNDPRVEWFLSLAGDLRSQTILELGPLEGGHSYMFARKGVKSVTAIEANARAYLKCLITKEVYGLQSVKFMLGDFIAYLRESGEQFDICAASGVLYHMTNPIEMIELASKKAHSLFIWTHYCDPDSVLYSRVIESVHAGFSHSLYVRPYGRELGWEGFCGGSRKYACWLTREDILASLRFFGFNRIETAFEQPDHSFGPSFAISAFK